MMDVKTLCLGVLTLGDATGYEIRKQFEEGPFAHFFDASYGSIYPSLGRLLDGGLVSVTRHAQDGKPDKKVYSLTPAGRARFIDALGEMPGPDKIRSEYLVYLFFAELLPDGQLEAVFEAYLGHFTEMSRRIAELSADGVPAGRMFVRRMGHTFYRAMAEFMEQHREDLLSGAEPARLVPGAADQWMR